MITYKLITNEGRKTDVVSENTTLKQIVEDNNVNLLGAQLQCDGIPIGVSELNKTLAELGYKTEATVILASIVKSNNA